MTPARGPKNSHARRFRGLVTASAALLVAAVLMFHTLVPEVEGVVPVFESFLPWYGLAIPILAIAAIARRSPVAMASVLVAATVWGVIFWPQLLPLETKGDATLTIASENIMSENPRPSDAANALAATDVDVVAVQEFDDNGRKAVNDALGGAYPHSEVVSTVGVWSKRPLFNPQSLNLGLNWARALSVDVDTPSGQTRIYVVHLDSLRPGDSVGRDKMLGQLADTIRADKSPRIVIIGDFNTATTDRKFTQLTNLAPEVHSSDFGFGFTWPAPFPAIRLDHALVKGLQGVSSRILDNNGSDHRGFTVSLR
jgi:vancomycin resistance protein VanJ